MDKAFYSTKDIMGILGCCATKAKQIKKAVNDEAVKRGMFIASVKLCSSSLFTEMYIEKKRSM